MVTALGTLGSIAGTSGLSGLALTVGIGILVRIRSCCSSIGIITFPRFLVSFPADFLSRRASKNEPRKDKV